MDILPEYAEVHGDSDLRWEEQPRIIQIAVEDAVIYTLDEKGIVRQTYYDGTTREWVTAKIDLLYEG